MRGVFLDIGSLYADDLVLDGLRASLDEWHWFTQSSPEQALARVDDAEVVISNKVPITEAVLAAAPRARLVCVAATGTNNVDLVAARRRGVAVCNVPNYATPSVVQHTFALLLMVRECLAEYVSAVREGQWQRSDTFSWLRFPFEELNGQVFGVVGYGASGRGVAAVARAFGMDVRVAALPGREYDLDTIRVPFEALLPQVDVLSLHCPLTPQTRHLINAAAVQRMKPSAVILNTARGDLIDEAALLAALQARTIAGAGLDVLAVEPPREDSTLLRAPLPNLVVTPHIAWGSRSSRQRLLDELAENIRAFRRGETRNVVN